ALAVDRDVRLTHGPEVLLLALPTRVSLRPGDLRLGGPADLLLAGERLADSRPLEPEVQERLALEPQAPLEHELQRVQECERIGAVLATLRDEERESVPRLAGIRVERGELPELRHERGHAVRHPGHLE